MPRIPVLKIREAVGQVVALKSSLIQLYTNAEIVSQTIIAQGMILHIVAILTLIMGFHYPNHNLNLKTTVIKKLTAYTIITPYHANLIMRVLQTVGME